MPRVQAIVVRNDRVLMVKHRHHDDEWWCLPGGGQEPGESPQQGALRELHEECSVSGKIIRQTSYVCYGKNDETYTFLVEIGDQSPSLGHDPEFLEGEQVLVDVKWLRLADIAERDRVFLWAAGLLGIGDFLAEVERWGDLKSYPEQEQSEK
ncbi:NUDIX hydrolase [Chloroflexi bacterium TSY]|nr:NUDIX hydrolase [Chloroflexi bacterium TSY]